jgi:hypothetical protein
MDPNQLAQAQQGLDKGKKTMGGWTGKLAGAFMGQGFVNQTNAAMDAGQAAIDMAAKQTALLQSGTDATAMVESIADTGRKINYNPVVKMSLKVTPIAGGEEFPMDVETWVSSFAMPRVGDKINLKYDPNDKTNVMVMGVVPPAMNQ